MSTTGRRLSWVIRKKSPNTLGPGRRDLTIDMVIKLVFLKMNNVNITFGIIFSNSSLIYFAGAQSTHTATDKYCLWQIRVKVVFFTTQYYLINLWSPGKALYFCLLWCSLLFYMHRFITGSYDRTCRVWNTLSGAELLTLEGHRNVVYAIAFNNPYG